MKALRSLTATLALAALSILPAAGAQAHAADQEQGAAPVSRPADQTPAQRTLARVLAREHDTYPAPSGPETQAAQPALTRTLAREHHTYPAPADGQAANAHRAVSSGTFPLLPVLAPAGLIIVLATAATWRRRRARSRPREAT